MSSESAEKQKCGQVFSTRAEDLPETLPIFPLAGVLLLPGGRLPLNIFEPRYLAMIEEALRHNRLVGMVQPTGHTLADGRPQVFQVGCAGRIHSFSETDDGRYLVSLLGVCRFRIREELAGKNGFRMVAADWQNYVHDLDAAPVEGIDRAKLMQHMRCYFKLQGVMGDWDMIEKSPDCRLITSLAMICPFSPGEKQALLEARTLQERCQLLTMLMDMALHAHDDDECESQRH